MNSMRYSVTVRKSLSAIVAILALSLSGITNAQEEPPAMPDMARKLQVFAGDYEGTISMTQGEMKSEGKVMHINKSIADGWGVEIREVCEIKDMQTYRALNIFGYDMGTGLTHLYTVDNYADVHDHVGKWADDKTLNLEHNGMMGDKPTKEVLHIVVDSPTQYHYTVEGYLGGELTYSMQGTLHKK